MSSPNITADNARFVASPIPATLHIVSVAVYSLLGALQFVPLLRRGRHNWRRIAGRILIPAGALVALTGLWMNFFYPRPPGDGESLVVVRLIVGTAMLGRQPRPGRRSNRTFDCASRLTHWCSFVGI